MISQVVNMKGMIPSIVADINVDLAKASFTKAGIAEDQIVVGEADWVEEGDSVLKAKIAVQFDVTFEGGIYADFTKKAVEIGNIQNGG